jgi:glutathione S-transferase
MTTTYEVLYFPIHGRAEAIRLLLALAGQPFVNHTLTRDEWAAEKPRMPLGQMPVLVERDEHGERMIPQSLAILRHLARKFGLAGQNEDEMVAIDVVAETAVDAGAGLGPLVHGAGRGDAAAFARHFGDVWPVHARRLQTLLARNVENRGFFVGTKPSFADVLVFQVLHGHLALSPGCLESFAALRAFYDRMTALPQWQQHLATRPVHEGVAARPA